MHRLRNRGAGCNTTHGRRDGGRGSAHRVCARNWLRLEVVDYCLSRLRTAGCQHLVDGIHVCIPVDNQLAPTTRLVNHLAIKRKLRLVIAMHALAARPHLAMTAPRQGNRFGFGPRVRMSRLHAMIAAQPVGRVKSCLAMIARPFSAGFTGVITATTALLALQPETWVCEATRAQKVYLHA